MKIKSVNIEDEYNEDLELDVNIQDLTDFQKI